MFLHLLILFVIVVFGSKVCKPVDCGIPLFPLLENSCSDGRQMVVECRRQKIIAENSNVRQLASSSSLDDCRWQVRRDHCVGSSVLSNFETRKSFFEQRRGTASIGIVLTGQLSRVEITSKLQYFLSKRDFDGVSIVLFIVLAEGNGVFFKNEFNSTTLPMFEGTLEQLFDEFSQK
jgi:hypothetical protein